MNVGKNITKFRKEKNLTQEELAKKINISAKAISSYENNRNLPNIETLILLSQVLDVKIDDILGITKDNSTELNKKYQNKKTKNIILLVLLSLIPSIFFSINGYMIGTSLMAKYYHIGELTLVDFQQAIMNFLLFGWMQYITFVLLAIILYCLLKNKKYKITLAITLILFVLSADGLFFSGFGWGASDALLAFIISLIGLIFSIKGLLKKNNVTT